MRLKFVGGKKIVPFCCAQFFCLPEIPSVEKLLQFLKILANHINRFASEPGNVVASIFFLLQRGLFLERVSQSSHDLCRTLGKPPAGGSLVRRWQSDSPRSKWMGRASNLEFVYRQAFRVSRPFSELLQSQELSKMPALALVDLRWHQPGGGLPSLMI